MLLVDLTKYSHNSVLKNGPDDMIKIIDLFGEQEDRQNHCKV